jgi:hypothetical protein
MKMLKNLLLIILFLAIFVIGAGAFQRASMSTFTASITFGDSDPPQISHTGLLRVSNVTKYAVFKGTATDNVGLNSVSVNYYFDDAISYSTKTISPTGATRDAFIFELQFNEKNASKLNYRIVARDGTGNQGYWPAGGGFYQVGMPQNITKSFDSSGGTLVLPDGNPDDGETSIEIPSGAMDSAVNISITELAPLDSEIPPGSSPAISKTAVAVYRFEPSGTVFKKPIKVSLLFPDVNKDGIADGTNYNISSLKAMWWDGFDWRVLGTTIDSGKNLAVANAKHFSYYAVFPAGPLTDDDYRPKEKIITPATVDGYNDFATFGALGPDDTVNIFDIRGRRVKHLKDDFTWDGKDEDGRLVESGIYIYQIHIPGRMISGTIVVAK